MKQRVTEIEINDTPVEIKARTDDRHASGWSVIAFTPELSIRSTKLNRPIAMDSFIDSILGACGSVSTDDAAFHAVRLAVQSVMD